MLAENKVNVTLCPFQLNLLDFDPKSTAWVELEHGSTLYDLAKDYIPGHLIEESFPQSFSVNIIKPEGSHGDVCKSASRTKLDLGLGSFVFVDTRGLKLRALHQAIGAPIGTDCGADWYRNLVIFSPDIGQQNDLVLFCNDLVKASETTDEGRFSIFNWNLCRQIWRKEGSCKARPVESVVLPNKLKDKLFKDVDRFLDSKTRLFYERHGIPYRRSYLFHGLAGAGKTSLVQALAGRLHRNLYNIQPTHPKMTDDSLRAAVTGVPENAIVVIEDIDALFAKDRKKKVESSPLTFSGLLNALDGIGSATGQIFVLTTNLREELDPALIRNGRVDMHIEFGYAEEEQMRDMWTSFYPDAADKATEFVSTLQSKLGKKQIVMATLQHFFVQQMHSTAEEALGEVDKILEELTDRELKKEDEVDAKDEISDGGKTDKSADSVDTVSSIKQKYDNNKDTHVHLHLHK